MFYLGCIMYIISILLFFLLVFFFVLIERKILGLSQSRLGPNKVSFMGLLQSLADFVKLAAKIGLLNNYLVFYVYRGFIYNFSLFIFFFSCILFICFFVNYIALLVDGFLVMGWLIVFSSLGGYGFLLCGWGSSSKYSLYGGLRASFSSITFEGCLMCVVLLIGGFVGSYSFSYLYFNSSVLLVCCCFIAYVLFFLSLLCECQRSPFDFSESESDLVSGFNVDYYGLSFSLIFACEYAIMVFFSWLCGVLFWGSFISFFFMFIHSFFFIFVRACFPRVRYDYFVSFVWQNVLLGLVVFLFVVI
nr:NADH dehydrogenase subunit 1 [Diplorchis sp.]